MRCKLHEKWLSLIHCGLPKHTTQGLATSGCFSAKNQESSTWHGDSHMVSTWRIVERVLSLVRKNGTQHKAEEQDVDLTLLSLSGLVAELFPQASEALSGEVGSPARMVTARPLGSVSREAVVMLGQVSEAAAAQARGALTRPILTAAMWVAGPAIGGGSCGEAKGWWGRPADAGPRQAVFCTWMGVTAAVGRSWLCAATSRRQERKQQNWLSNKCYSPKHDSFHYIRP